MIKSLGFSWFCSLQAPEFEWQNYKVQDAAIENLRRDENILKERYNGPEEYKTNNHFCHQRSTLFVPTCVRHC